MRPQTTSLALLLLSFSLATTRADEPKTERDPPRPAPPEVRAHGLITIPTNTFKMGSPVEPETSKYYRPEEKPQYDVTVNEFAIGRFLVTAEEYCQFLNSEPDERYLPERWTFNDSRTIKKSGERFVPQEGAERCSAQPVTWVGADAYAERIGQHLGLFAECVGEPRVASILHADIEILPLDKAGRNVGVVGVAVDLAFFVPRHLPGL